MTKNTRKDVFTIRVNQKSGQKYWTKLGVAFVNEDGNMSIYLDGLPVNGELVTRDVRQEQRQPPQQQQNGNDDNEFPGSWG